MEIQIKIDSCGYRAFSWWNVFRMPSINLVVIWHNGGNWITDISFFYLLLPSFPSFLSLFVSLSSFFPHLPISIALFRFFVSPALSLSFLSAVTLIFWHFSFKQKFDHPICVIYLQKVSSFSWLPYFFRICMKVPHFLRFSPKRFPCSLILSQDLSMFAWNARKSYLIWNNYKTFFLYIQKKKKCFSTPSRSEFISTMSFHDHTIFVFTISSYISLSLEKNEKHRRRKNRTEMIFRL